MAKKKAAKKAKAASKPAKAVSKKKTSAAKKTTVKAKTKTAKPVKKTAKPANKAVAKPVKKAAAKPTNKTVAKPTKKAVAKPAKKVVAKPVKKVVAKPVKKVVAKVIEKPAKATPKQSAPKVKDAGHILAESVVNGILEKKGQNIKWLDLRGIENAVCDYFIICEGNSNTQVEAIASSVEEIVKKETAQRPYRSEGWENALWILIDYIDVVVHVFEKETRYFYNLESLWADAVEIKVNE